METKFNFNSQVCTSRSQSERLLSLGLKKETADMCWTKMAAKRGTFYVPELAPINMVPWRHTPAWSLHRLILMTPKELIVNNGVVFPFRGTALMDLTVNGCDLYEGLVQIIERGVKEGFIPKEYLV